MTAAPIIEAKGLSKAYRLYHSPYGRLLERLPWNKKQRYREVKALEDVNFDVKPGECMGLIGSNGAGKSTLLKVLSGTTYPTAGSYTVRGRVTSLLELGAGFHMNFSGRENIFMNAAMMGFSRKEAQRKYQEIVEFSELGDFINAPVRTYSSGMGARLGFSVAVATEPDLLIIDEILAVGDMNFRRKCVDKIWDYKKRGKSMFFCSHSLYDVRQICERAIWMRNGRMQLLADSITVTNEYATYEAKVAGAADPVEYDGVPKAQGAETDLPCITDAWMVDPKTGERRNTFAPGDPLTVRVFVRNGKKRERLSLAIGFMRKDGTLCFAHTTQFAGQIFDFEEGVVQLHFDRLGLLSGEFTVPVWLFDEHGVHRFHERPANDNLIVQNRTKDLGLFLQEHRWQIESTRA
ncbi:MAG: ABC transporter ATP-binding protein [Planctomycetes bacterium]|nr:ABC transporter ATP-binding protein [Planctomycetota bacterium]MCC7399761.1 ABC transporter ATP-binding protein [Planctomycetota bacterium]